MLEGCIKLLSAVSIISMLMTNSVYANPTDISGRSYEQTEKVSFIDIELSLKEVQKKEFMEGIKILNTPSYTQEEIKSVVTTNKTYVSGVSNTTSSDIYTMFKNHCSLVNNDNASIEILESKYQQAGYLWKSEKIDMYTFNQILTMLEYTYKQYGVESDKNDYLKVYLNECYQHSWEVGIYDDYMSSIYGYGSLGNPYGYKATPSGDMVLATAYAVADSWTKGTSGESLRYSQTKMSMYDSAISDKVFLIRPDCTGFCYTILKELGCKVVDTMTIRDGFYSGSMVQMCRNGVFESDPTIKVIPFDVNQLEPGDIMVTAKTERLTRWGTTESYSGVEGHAEIFVGFPDENNKTIIDVWNWGSSDGVNRNFPVESEVFIPQRKAHPYNYTYIIRYIGGTRH